MPFQKVVIEFPEETRMKQNTIEVEDSGEVEIDISGKRLRTTMRILQSNLKSKLNQNQTSWKLRLWMIRQRLIVTASHLSHRLVTDEELKATPEKVRNRIKHFSKGYHDERRAKEAAFRKTRARSSYPTLIGRK